MELTNERTTMLKKILDTGNINLNKDEIYILNNAVRWYSKREFNNETKQRIENLTAKLTMLYSKDNAVLSKEVKFFVDRIIEGGNQKI